MATRSRTGRIMGAAEEAVESVENSASRLAGDMKDNISHIGSNMGRTAQDALGQVSQTVTQRMKDAGVDTDAIAEVAKNQASKLQQIMEDELRERPVRTLAIAAAVGLVVGLMTTR